MPTPHIVRIDIRGFAKDCASRSDDEVARTLQQFYARVFEHADRLGFEIVKTMGDCVLLIAPGDGEAGDVAAIELLHAAVGAAFEINTAYRRCTFTRATIQHGDYACRDVFGRDINALFMNDGETVKLR